jgi:N-hydroxyarylamine O-acetyltransferase
VSSDVSFDLEAYLARIQFSGARIPRFETLAKILFRHVCAIPFENLDILLGRGIRIDLASVQQKLVGDKRGGYCFEHNTLLAAALRSLGFRVTTLSARVRWQVPPETETALTHMTLLVEADGRRCIVDGGFGAASLSAPLLLDTEAEQPTPHEPRRLLRRDGAYVHQVKHTGEWADLYVFTLQPMLTPDYEMGNWFTSTWPQSRFRQNLTVALTHEHGRCTLLNRELTLRRNNGQSEKRELATPDELLEVLARYFNLPFPSATRFGSPDAPWPV